MCEIDQFEYLPAVVELLDGVLHVLVPEELHDSGAVLVDVGVADVAGFAHVIFQILPRSGRRQALRKGVTHEMW